MVKYLLIVLMLPHGCGGLQPLVLEFESRSSCEVAKQEFLSLKNKELSRANLTFTAVCVQK